MRPLLITDIGLLVGLHPKATSVISGKNMADLPTLANAWLLCRNGLIDDYGTSDCLPSGSFDTHSAKGGYVFPSWCDSHTHAVFAAPREEEFVMKIKGKSYAEITAAGGGILNSAAKLQDCTELELFEDAELRIHGLIKQGTGALEIKSGYGLTVESELKMLRVIRRLKETLPIPVKASFLAAHTYPYGYQTDHTGYLELIIHNMLPKIADEGLADFMDVFCEVGFFSADETAMLLEAGAKYGLPPKIHANQFSLSGGAQTGVKHHAISVDHLEVTDQDVVEHLAAGTTMATLLPGCSFYLGIPFANARALLNAGVAVALASDLNPGSSPSGNMNLVVSLGCIKLKMLPEEAINAATLNGAAAMILSDQIGSIAIGKRANFFITNPMPSLAYLPYSFGDVLVNTVILNGEVY